MSAIDIMKCAGQGGWTNAGDLDANDVKGQVNLAFENVGRVLRASGLLGWEDVYSVRSHHVDMGSSYNFVVEKLKQRIPNHHPIWTDCYFHLPARFPSDIDRA